MVDTVVDTVVIQAVDTAVDTAADTADKKKLSKSFAKVQAMEVTEVMEVSLNPTTLHYPLELVRNLDIVDEMKQESKATSYTVKYQRPTAFFTVPLHFIE